MDTDGDNLIRAIIAEPKEDTPRLAYADWLEDQGQASHVARAAFIRKEVELQAIIDHDSLPHEKIIAECLAEEIEALLKEWNSEWSAVRCPACRGAGKIQVDKEITSGKLHEIDVGEVEFRVKMSAYLCPICNGRGELFGSLGSYKQVERKFKTLLTIKPPDLPEDAAPLETLRDMGRVNPSYARWIGRNAPPYQFELGTYKGFYDFVNCSSEQVYQIVGETPIATDWARTIAALPLDICHRFMLSRIRLSDKGPSMLRVDKGKVRVYGWIRTSYRQETDRRGRASQYINNFIEQSVQATEQLAQMQAAVAAETPLSLADYGRLVAVAGGTQNPAPLPACQIPDEIWNHLKPDPALMSPLSPVSKGALPVSKNWKWYHSLPAAVEAMSVGVMEWVRNPQGVINGT
jgi:uncharacterized protein (TIGR02996 family)